MDHIILFGILVFIAAAGHCEDMFHVTCENGEIRASGPVADVHAECSKGLDATAEKNMCEFQCIRQKEGLLDAAGLPSLEKHISYIKKVMSGDIATKAEKETKMCFEKHLAAVQHHEKDNLCASSKEFNSCIKDQIMNICVPK